MMERNVIVPSASGLPEPYRDNQPAEELPDTSLAPREPSVEGYRVVRKVQRQISPRTSRPSRCAEGHAAGDTAIADPIDFASSDAARFELIVEPCGTPASRAGMPRVAVRGRSTMISAAELNGIYQAEFAALAQEPVNGNLSAVSLRHMLAETRRRPPGA